MKRRQALVTHRKHPACGRKALRAVKRILLLNPRRRIAHRKAARVACRFPWPAHHHHYVFGADLYLCASSMRRAGIRTGISSRSGGGAASLENMARGGDSRSSDIRKYLRLVAAAHLDSSPRRAAVAAAFLGADEIRRR